MSVDWVAGAVRARALARRRLADDGVAALAATGSLGDAVAFLAASSYGSRLEGHTDGLAARRAIAETTLWHLRVLAGWLPSRGVHALRAVAGWFELLDIETHAWALAAGDRWRDPPLPLGALATVWPRVSATTTLRELRVVLAHSSWGDPGGDELVDILLGLRLGWARALRDVVPTARAWGDAALALNVAKSMFAHTPSGNDRKRPDVPELGAAWRRTTTIAAFAAAIPDSARWVLHDVRQFPDLWHAERTWWLQVDREAAQLLRSQPLGRTAVIAAAMLLVTDNWRTLAAFDEAARGSVREDVRARA
jgi:hypothetical protein